MEMIKIVNYNGVWYSVIEKNDDITLVPLDPERSYSIIKKTENSRTVKQNSAMHKYFSKVSNALNDGGFSIQKVVAKFKKADIKWTMLSVKDVIWRNIQIAILKKESTTTLSSDEVTEVYKYVDHYLSNSIGIESIDFPSIESMIFEQKYKDQ